MNFLLWSDQQQTEQNHKNESDNEKTSWKIILKKSKLSFCFELIISFFLGENEIEKLHQTEEMQQISTASKGDSDLIFGTRTATTYYSHFEGEILMNKNSQFES